MSSWGSSWGGGGGRVVLELREGAIIDKKKSRPSQNKDKGKDDIIPGKSFGNRVEHMIHPIPRKNNATLKAYPHEQESLFL